MSATNFIICKDNPNKFFLQCECGCSILEISLDEDVTKFRYYSDSDKKLPKSVTTDFELSSVGQLDIFINALKHVDSSEYSPDTNPTFFYKYNKSNQVLEISKDEDFFYLTYYMDTDKRKQDKAIWCVILDVYMFNKFYSKLNILRGQAAFNEKSFSKGHMVKIKSYQDLYLAAQRVDSAGRLEFALPDSANDTILFNKEMEKFCGEYCIIDEVNTFISQEDGELNYTLKLRSINLENTEISDYTFIPEMVEKIK